MSNSRLNYEFQRLLTFSSWQSGTIVEPASLAKAGFYATGVNLEVICYWCQTKINDWKLNDRPMEIHRRLNSVCSFVLNRNDCDNIPIQTDESEAINNEQINNNFQSTGSGSELFRDLKDERCRLNTFQNWPLSYITPYSLATAGFYYFNSRDYVKCVWCNTVLGQWDIGDDPFFEHHRLVPTCAKVQLDHNFKITNHVIRDLEIQDIFSPKMPRYSTLDARLHSFAEWERYDVQHPKNLAIAGFYYQGMNDQVKCFHCNGGLKCWMINDEPWFEHARWFPTCQFVYLIKGGSFIQNAESYTEAVLNGHIEEYLSDDTILSSSPIPLLSTNRRRNITYNSSECASQQSATTAAFKHQAIIEVEKSKIDEEEVNTSKAILKYKMKAITSGRSLKEEIRKLKDARNCKICMDVEVGVVFLPCGHLVTCVQCASRVVMCPLCRSSIEQSVRTFLS